MNPELVKEMHNISRRLIRLHQRSLAKSIGDMKINGEQYLNINLAVISGYAGNILYQIKNVVENKCRENGENESVVDVNGMIHHIADALIKSFQLLETMNGEKGDDTTTH